MRTVTGCENVKALEACYISRLIVKSGAAEAIRETDESCGEINGEPDGCRQSEQSE
jgi:hypothetical protein